MPARSRSLNSGNQALSCHGWLVASWRDFFRSRLGNEKYKSKNSPRAKWLEQFDLHLFEEDQLLEVVVCSRNINIGRCLIDLKSLPRETTHRLWNKFEDCIGEIFLLLTISGTTSSETISDLTTYREDLTERTTLQKKYVSYGYFIVLGGIGSGGGLMTSLGRKNIFWRYFVGRIEKTALSSQESWRTASILHAPRSTILQLSALFRCLLEASQSQKQLQNFYHPETPCQPFYRSVPCSLPSISQSFWTSRGLETFRAPFLHLSCTFVSQNRLLRWSLRVPRYIQSFNRKQTSRHISYSSRPFKVWPSDEFSQNRNLWTFFTLDELWNETLFNNKCANFLTHEFSAKNNQL